MAVVVVLGLAWNHFASGTVTGALHGSGTARVLPGQHLKVRPGGGRRIQLGGPAGPQDGINLGLNSMFQSVNFPYLKHTLAVEAALIAAVVLISAGRRKLRRGRRSRQISLLRSGTADAASHAPAPGEPTAR